MSIERLVEEFGAQDVGAYMVVFRGEHIKVAVWATDHWSLTPEGKALLTADVEAPVVADDPQDVLPKRVKKTKVALAPDVEFE